jgi:hypothetical protein
LPAWPLRAARRRRTAIGRAVASHDLPALGTLCRRVIVLEQGGVAVRHGRDQFETGILVFAVAVLAVLVQVIRSAGATLARRLDKNVQER